MDNYEFLTLSLKALMDEVNDLNAFKNTLSSKSLKAYTDCLIKDYSAAITEARARIVKEVSRA